MQAIATIRQTVQQAVVDILENLPLDKQQELLNYAEFLQSKNSIKPPRKSLEGLCADLDIDITEEDLKIARQEMWGNFPRDIEL
jgi:hypothetical protein